MAVQLGCTKSGCEFSTPAMSEAGAIRLLEMHQVNEHSAVAASAEPAASSTPKSSTPKPSRPELTAGLTEEDWEYFQDRWTTYKTAANLTNPQVAIQLLDCCEESLRRDLHRNLGSGLSSRSESDLLSEIKRLAVQERNRMVNRVQLLQLTQDEGEPVRHFAARVKGLASICEFTVTCTRQGCGTNVSYAQEVIRDQVIQGLINPDVQRDLLSQPENKKMDLEAALAFVEAKELGLRSQGLLDKPAGLHAKVSDFQRQKRVFQTKGVTRARGSDTTQAPRARGSDTTQAPRARGSDTTQAQLCAYCGKPGHGDQAKAGIRASKCPAWGKTCFGCGRSGHFKSVCRAPSSRSREDTNATLSAGMSLDPEADSSFFMSMCSVSSGSKVSGKHLLVDHCVWADALGWVRRNAPGQPWVSLDVSVSKESYRELHLPLKQRKLKTAAEVRSCPDTGAQTTVSGPFLLTLLGMQPSDLLPVSLTIRTAGNRKMEMLGGVFIDITGHNSSGGTTSTKQLCYIAKDCPGLFLSREACTNLGIISQRFPTVGEYPDTPEEQVCTAHADSTPEANDKSSGGCEQVSGHIHEPASNHSVKEGSSVTKCGTRSSCLPRSQPPAPPSTLPYAPVPENVEKLKQWILERYAASAFNICEHQPLPRMHGEPLEIFLKPHAIPKAVHTPIPVPLHWQDAVKHDLDRDVRLKVIEKVPPGIPTTWCHRMVTVAKKDGTPRRTIDFQALNQESMRQTHHTPPPFHQVNVVPTNTLKTVLDAWNGYHSVSLHENSRDCTTFITPWGRYRYLTTPQGYMAAGDAYTHRFDLVTRDVPFKVKCVDDTLMWADSIEQCFFRTCEYLTLCSSNGIIFNPKKFQFAKDTVEFTGFEVTPDSVKPSKAMLESIKSFPMPKDITGVRSWFGLVQQVSYAYATRPAMAPFRELLKPSVKFYWDEELERLFGESKQMILRAVEDGVKTFQKGRPTCLATDYSKTGIGFCLTQKYCSCESDSPYCCPDGWRLVLAGSRFTSPAESRYAPIEGEALAVADALEKARFFVMGCNNLILATDHKPLVSILGDRNLEDVSNPRLLKLKERTLKYSFKVIHVPGRQHGGPDAMSRKPAMSVIAGLHCPMTEDEDGRSSHLELYVEAIIASAARELKPISLERIRDAVAKDCNMQALVHRIQNGFHESKHMLEAELRQYFRFRACLTTHDGLPLYQRRIVVPQALRGEVLEVLHSAHQGVDGMNARARTSVWWPGITGEIKQQRMMCRTCNQVAPSQPAAPPTTSDPPEYPFQKTCGDYFSLNGSNYLVLVDRYSNWLSVFHCGKGEARANTLVQHLRTMFHTFGVPEELSTDGGPQFASGEVKSLLRNYGIHHRVSSVGFPHSNLRAELAVKTGKRLIRDNVDMGGRLDNDKFCRALLQYRNTPDRDLGLSPAQIIFGKHMNDFMPVTRDKFIPREEWRVTGKEREWALRKRHLKEVENISEHTRILPSLAVGDCVQVQNQVGNRPRRWDMTGSILEVLPFDQYRVMMHGSRRVTLRNRRFLRRIVPVTADGSNPRLQAPIPVPPQVHRTQSPLLPTPSPMRLRPHNSGQPTTREPESQPDEADVDPVPSSSIVDRRCTSDSQVPVTEPGSVGSGVPGSETRSSGGSSTDSHRETTSVGAPTAAERPKRARRPPRRLSPKLYGKTHDRNAAD